MKQEIKITYQWSNQNGNEVKERHREALEETAIKRIYEMMTDGYTSGELYDCMTDGEDGIEYSGWWSMTTTNC